MRDLFGEKLNQFVWITMDSSEVCEKSTFARLKMIFFDFVCFFLKEKWKTVDLIKKMSIFRYCDLSNFDVLCEQPVTSTI